MMIRLQNPTKAILLLLLLLHLSPTVFCRNTEIENQFLHLLVNGQKIQINSKQLNQVLVKNMQVPGNILSVQKTETESDLWGKGQQIGLGCDDGRHLELTLFENNPFVFIHTSFENRSEKDIQISEAQIVQLELSVGNEEKELKSLGSGGLSSGKNPQGSFLYSLLTDPESRNAILTAWLTQNRGVGFFSPEWNNRRSSYHLKAGLEFGNYLVPRGKSRDTDTLIIGLFADGRDALELYGDYIAKAYQIRLPARPEVYCTWYHRDLTGSGASTEQALMANARFAQRELQPFGLNTFQIDDHWQDSMIEGIDYKNQNEQSSALTGNGPLKSFAKNNFNFPAGMSTTARNLNKAGFTAGIWFMPFSGDVRNPYFEKEIFARRLFSDLPYEVKNWSGTCIDATNPAGEKFLRKRFKRIYDWGYRYFKIDGLHTGAPSENRYIHRFYDGNKVYGEATLYDPLQTFTQCFRKGLSILKEEAPDVFLLGCSVTQNMSSFAPSFGLVHAMRVGPDNDRACLGNWEQLTRGADYAGNLYFLNNRVWHNDPDPYYVRESNALEKARWMVSWQSIAGVMSTTSMEYAGLPKERLDLIKRGLPTHTLNARPVDILENEHPAIWKVGNDRMNIIGLFNWSEQDRLNLNYPFSRMDLDAGQTYELFDFWEDSYLGQVTDSLTLTLKPAACRVLAIRTAKPHPQIISTSRHLTQGLMDIVEEEWVAGKNTLRGKSAVVKGDRYELRIIVPDNRKIKKAVCNKTAMEVIADSRCARVVMMPDHTGMVEWEICF